MIMQHLWSASRDGGASYSYPLLTNPLLHSKNKRLIALKGGEAKMISFNHAIFASHVGRNPEINVT